MYEICNDLAPLATDVSFRHKLGIHSILLFGFYGGNGRSALGGLQNDMPSPAPIGRKQKKFRETEREMAPEVGLEPTTTRLTAACSTIELLWNLNGRTI